jgi:hypothetical protein
MFYDDLICHQILSDKPRRSIGILRPKYVYIFYPPNVTAITSFYFITNSTTGSRQAEYPLDLLPLTLTNLRNPSEVRVYNYNTRTEITGQEDVTSGTFTANIDATTYPTVDISVLSLGYQNTRYLSQSLGSSGLTIPVSQVIDRQYLNS